MANAKQKSKVKRVKYPGFNLVEDTTGIILNGVYVKEDFSEIIVSMAWKGDIHFKPESDIKSYEKRANLLPTKVVSKKK